MNLPKYPKYPAALDAISAIRTPTAHLDAARELSRSLELLAERLQADMLPFHSISEQFTEQLRWRESVAAKALEAFRPFHDLGNQISEALGPMQNLQASLGATHRLAEQLQPSLRAIQQLDSNVLRAASVSFPSSVSTHFAGLASIASALRFDFEPSKMAYVSKILSEELTSALYETAQSADELVRADAVEIAGTAASRIQARDASFPIIGMFALLQILVPILIAWHATVSDEQRWEQLSDQLHEIAEIQRKTQEEKTQLRTRFVVLRQLKLRAEPNTSAAVLKVLPENQEVELLYRQGQWLHVTYYDHSAAVPRTGWVYKRHLREITGGKLYFPAQQSDAGDEGRGILSAEAKE